MTDQNTNRFALNGGRDESSAILVDGVPISAPGWGGAIAVPSQDAVSEPRSCVRRTIPNTVKQMAEPSR